MPGNLTLDFGGPRGQSKITPILTTDTVHHLAQDSVNA